MRVRLLMWTLVLPAVCAPTASAQVLTLTGDVTISRAKDGDALAGRASFYTIKVREDEQVVIKLTDEGMDALDGRSASASISESLRRVRRATVTLIPEKDVKTTTITAVCIDDAKAVERNEGLTVVGYQCLGAGDKTLRGSDGDLQVEFMVVIATKRDTRTEQFLLKNAVFGLNVGR